MSMYMLANAKRRHIRDSGAAMEGDPALRILRGQQSRVYRGDFYSDADSVGSRSPPHRATASFARIQEDSLEEMVVEGLWQRLLRFIRRQWKKVR